MKKLLFLVTAMLFAININAQTSEIFSIEDIVEFRNLMKGTSSCPTEQAKRNYERARPRIVALAQKYGFSIYEYNYVNGNLGYGELSSYNCCLYKNCNLKKDKTGPTFSPQREGVSCVIDGRYIKVYNKNTYNQLVNQIKERCGNILYTLIENYDDSKIHFYSDGEYCFLVGEATSFEIIMDEMDDVYKEAMRQLTFSDMLSIYNNRQNRAFVNQLLTSKGYKAKDGGWEIGSTDNWPHITIKFDNGILKIEGIADDNEEWINEMENMGYRVSANNGGRGQAHLQYHKNGKPNISYGGVGDSFYLFIGE